MLPNSWITSIQWHDSNKIFKYTWLNLFFNTTYATKHINHMVNLSSSESLLAKFPLIIWLPNSILVGREVASCIKTTILNLFYFIYFLKE